MPASIGVNLRVTGHCSQGGRKYMEDLFSVAYQQTEDERDLEYAFFGIYDGHGGSEAAAFAKEHLMDSIVKQRQFWSENDEDVLKAIRNGYMVTHLNMWKELEKWPKTVTGLPSTAGTTASVAFIRRGKIYIGHVGDSAIVLGYQKDGCEEWAAKPLTCDHKPESTSEMERIQRCGGKVISKAGVPRVVWNRPRLGHKGPIKKNTPMDEIPFLAVARSLGDLWSYNTQNDEFIVSPDPDVGVLTVDPSKFRCLIFGTDGLWNMISPESAVSLVQATERHNEAAVVGSSTNQPRDWLNPSKSLVDHALERWSNTRMRADNTSVVTLMLDPPGPPRATVLLSRSQHQNAVPPTPLATLTENKTQRQTTPESDARQVPQNGLAIMTRFSDDKTSSSDSSQRIPLPPCTSLETGRTSTIECRDNDNGEECDAMTNYGDPSESYFIARLLHRQRVVNTLSQVYEEIVSGDSRIETREMSPQIGTEVPENATDANEVTQNENPACEESGAEDVTIQINEVSSSSPVEGPRQRGRRSRNDVKRDSVVNDRVLRSHDAERPQTRQTASRGRSAGGAPATGPPPLERVVILTRRAPAASSVPDAEEGRRATRSQQAPLAQKLSRGITNVVGNCPRAPGVARRTPAARREAPQRLRADCSKENLGGVRRRVRPGRAAPAPAPPAPLPPRPHTRRADSSDLEVHSTTGEVLAVPNLAARALRSRNDAEPPPAGGAKRARCEATSDTSAGVAAQKAPRATALRALAKRSGPWAPALALRNRLRKRLVK